MSNHIFKPFFLSMLLLMAGSSLFAQKDKGFNFPPDFGKTETTILIGEGTRDKITEAMIEAFEKLLRHNNDAKQNLY